MGSPAETERARRRLAAFTEHTFDAYTPAWHHRVLCDYLDALTRGEITRLMVFMPPRHGKSEHVSRRLPAQYLGLHPDHHVIACSYADDLAARMNRDCQRIIDSDAYNELFPDTMLAVPGRKGQAAVRGDDLFEIVGSGGSYRSAGVGGGITGMGFHLGIIDDPLKNAEQANSRTIRDKIDEWYRTTFWTRMAPDAKILITLTRWHDDDLAGRLLDRGGSDPDADQWVVLTLPAIAEAPLDSKDPRAVGDALWPERYPLKFLRAARAQMTPYEWGAIYQQRPTPEGGSHFKRSWFDVRYESSEREYVLFDAAGVVTARWKKCDCTVFVTCDPAASEKDSADYTAMAAWALTPANDLLCLDMVRDRFAVDRIVPELLFLCHRVGAAWASIEDTPKQAAIIAAARRREGMPPIRPLHHEFKSKLVRATAAIILAESGKIYLPREAAWVEAFLREHVAFSGFDGNEDDQVDNTSYAALQRPADAAAPAAPTGRQQPPVANAERLGLWGRGESGDNWRFRERK